ncbi:hypothetical protein [Aeropyrum camini]|uniref:hypothetical protein n=1 Tax=Aeropyrum camini TaxID=229980 RepID=UPI0012E24637|nr:hypothetical protein [Aeropyrum camini]
MASALVFIGAFALFWIPPLAFMASLAGVLVLVVLLLLLGITGLIGGLIGGALRQALD